MEWIKNHIAHALMEMEINPDRGKMRQAVDLAASNILKEHLQRMERAIQATRNSMTVEKEHGTS